MVKAFFAAETFGGVHRGADALCIGVRNRLDPFHRRRRLEIGNAHIRATGHGSGARASAVGVKGVAAGR